MSSTLSRQVLMELMAYADGELDDDDRQRIEAVLRESEEARAVVASLSPLGEFVRTSAEVGAEKADGIADAVMARIDTDANAAVPVTRAAANDVGAASELEAARARRASRNRVYAAAAAVAAIAAAYVLVARPAPTGDVVARLEPTATVAPSAVPLTPREAPSTATVAVATAGVEVEHVDAPNNDVSVIYVPAVATPDVNASSVVIWINDDKVAGGL